MNRIDRLIIKAQSAAASSGLELILAFVEPDGDSWTAKVHLHDGVQGHDPTIQRATYATMEAAVEHIRAMSREYPNSRDVPIIINDLPREYPSSQDVPSTVDDLGR